MEEVEENNNSVEEPFITNRSFLSPTFLCYLFFKINGRISRLEYLIGRFLAWLPFASLIFLFDYINNFFNSNETLIDLFTVFSVVFIVLADIQLDTKRLHDLDMSGIHQLWVFMPIINIAIAIMLIFQRGTPEKNLYGAPPSNTHTASTTGSSRILADDVSA
ncbi:MAG: DUF805 domain-containing protein [Gammaproteobacteria bacterium]|nr:DUF805 domain-containing protein [Gammaproteobacteria bacterium]